jgi:hypothetical protein
MIIQTGTEEAHATLMALARDFVHVERRHKQAWQVMNRLAELADEDTELSPREIRWRNRCEGLNARFVVLGDRIDPMLAQLGLTHEEVLDAL